MAQASLIYGWQFTPSYYDVVADTLRLEPDGSPTAPMESRLAPVALPMPPSSVAYNLEKESPPPPLVEGALYGSYIPKNIYPPIKNAPGPKELAWPDAAHVFFPGINGDKTSKTECWFFPMYWAGRVSDENNIALLPLMGTKKRGAFPKKSFFENSLEDIPPFTPVHRENIRWHFADAKRFPNLFLVDPMNPTVREPVFNGVLTGIKKEATRKAPYPDAMAGTGWSVELKDAIEEFPDQVDVGRNWALETFPKTVSPYVIANVSWDQVVTYMNGVHKAMLDHYAVGEQASTTLTLTNYDLLGDFGSEAQAEAVIANTLRNLRRTSAGIQTFNWWGMAHTEWLEAHADLVQAKALLALKKVVDAYQSKDVKRVFRGMGFPFQTPTGPSLVRGDELSVEGLGIGSGNMTTDGQKFYDNVLAPAAKALAEGFEKPTMTLEEAELTKAESKEAEKAGRDAKVTESKNLTKAQKAWAKAKDKSDKALTARNAAGKALEVYEQKPAYIELDGVKSKIEALEEMGITGKSIPTEITKELKSLEKKLGPKYKEAKDSVKKAENTLKAAVLKDLKAEKEATAAKQMLEKVEAAHEEAIETLANATKQIATILALESRLYLPSYGGYAQFLTDVRASYHRKRTPDSSVGAAFRWFSGSPQAVATQSGRWSADSVWATGLADQNAAARATKPALTTKLSKFPSLQPTGPVDVYMMDGTEVKLKPGTVETMKAGSYVLFEDLDEFFKDEFNPLFDAYKAAYPERNVDKGTENLVFEVTETAKEHDKVEDLWVTMVQPVAFFVPQYTSVAEFEGEVGLEDIPFGESEVPFEETDLFVRIPKVRVVGKKTPTKNPIPHTKAFHVEDVHAAADRAGVKWDNNKAFMDLTERLTGKRHLDDMNEKELRFVANYLEKKPIRQSQQRSNITFV